MGFQRLGQMPEGFVEPHIFIEASDGTRARMAFAIGLAAGIILQTTAQNSLLNPIIGSPKVVARIFAAARFQ